MARRKSIIIVGAGLSGMAAGCYGQMNGYNTKIYEMHFIPGGCCTAWDRKGYRFDMTIEWLLGSKDGSIMNQLWRELGALRGKMINNFEIFNSFTGVDGRVVHFYPQADKLEAALKAFSPQDKEPIEEFCAGLRDFMEIKDFFEYYLLQPMKLWSPFTRLKLFWSLRKKFKALGKAVSTSMMEFADRFQDPVLSEAMKCILYINHDTFPLVPTYNNLAASADSDAGFPQGGSLGLAQSIEQRYYELGGRILYEKKIRKIIVKNSRAVGVQLEDGSEDFADIVISACDGRKTMLNLLEGKYMQPPLDLLYRELVENQPQAIYPSLVLTFLGVNRDLSEEQHSMVYALDKALANQLPGICQSNVYMRLIRTNYSSEFAAPGKSVIFIAYPSEYTYWKGMYSDKAAYTREKKRVSEIAIDFLEKKHPGLRQQIEVVDVSTPVTIERYTGNHMGSMLAWKPFSRAEDNTQKILLEKGGMKMPGVKNLYLTGQWISCGGLIRSASSGRHVMQFICRDDHKRFRASEN